MGIDYKDTMLRIMKEKVEVKTPPKKEDKEVVDLLDNDKSQKVEKTSKKVFDFGAGLLLGHLFGIVNDLDSEDANARKIADRILAENNQKRLFKSKPWEEFDPDVLAKLIVGKAVNVASLAPVGDTDTGCKKFNPQKNSWEDCDKNETPTKRLRSHDVGRQKERKTSGRVRGANTGKRGSKTKV